MLHFKEAEMEIKKPDNPLDRRIAIMDMFDSEGWHGSCTAIDMAEMVGGTARGMSAAFRDLGFTITRPERLKRVPTGNGMKTKVERVLSQYTRPTLWPEFYELRRRLRRMGMSAGSAKHSNVTVVPDRYIEQAIGEVLLNNTGDAIKHRGVYKKALRKVVDDGTLDVVSVRELATALGEDSAVMTPAGLLGRAEGLMKVATRQKLEESA